MIGRTTFRNLSDPGGGNPIRRFGKDPGRGFGIPLFFGSRFEPGKKDSGILPEPLGRRWDTTPTRRVVKIQHWSGSTCGAVEFSIRAGDPVR